MSSVFNRPSPLASIVICSYNYGRFLAQAIDSALNQTYSHVEVIVVDDGSTDGSPAIIESYGSRVVHIQKENQGHDEAVHSGFRAASGDVVCFLDSDDGLFPTAMEEAVAAQRDPSVAKVHWPLCIVDEDGRDTGKLLPGGELPEGDLREIVIRCGPQSYPTPPTSGNAWARWFLGQVLPLQPMENRAGTADDQLSMLAPLFGEVRALRPQGFFRAHGSNNYWGRSVEHLATTIRDYQRYCEVLGRVCRDKGIDVDPQQWTRESWFYRLHQALQDVADLVPSGHAFVLADGDKWGTVEWMDGRRRIPFLARNGMHWGNPADDAEAIRETERLRREGASFMVLGWPVFWWREHYPEWDRHVRSTYPCIVENDRLVAFDLRTSAVGERTARRTSGTRGQLDREHPAVAAWRTLRPAARPPVSVLRLHQSAGAPGCETAVDRLTFDDRSPVIAKRCPAEAAAAEVFVYERVLPRLAVPALDYYGAAFEPDGTSGWLFLEEAIGSDYASGDREHRRAVARWLAGFHAAGSTLPLGEVLPDRQPEYFLRHLQSACAAIRAGLSNPALSSENRRILESVLDTADLFGARWGEIERFFRTIPSTVVHNDLSTSNLRVRRRSGELVIVPFDWEDAGWGPPAIDLAQFADHETAAYAVSPDLETYASLVLQAWPRLDREHLRVLAGFGATFRMCSELHWEQWRLSYRYQSEHELAWLRDYVHLAHTHVTRFAGLAPIVGWSG